VDSLNFAMHARLNDEKTTTGSIRSENIRLMYDIWFLYVSNFSSSFVHTVLSSIVMSVWVSETLFPAFVLLSCFTSPSVYNFMISLTSYYHTFYLHVFSSHILVNALMPLVMLVLFSV
jgi:hypothetical protein